MRVFFLGLAFFAFMLTDAQAFDTSASSLWVVFESNGQLWRAPVTEPDEQAYLRSYVAGQAPVLVPDRFSRAWLRQAGASDEEAMTHSIRILRAEQCSAADGRCDRLAGLYAGRSPD